MTESWTSLKLIEWTSGYFEKKGIPNPRLDAELLLAHTLKCPRIDLYTNHEKRVSEKDLARFKELTLRRAKREPLQYIIGETEFWGLKFKVTPEVLIPRPETELLVEEALKSAPPVPWILDIGTGSGCVAVAFAKKLPEAHVVATDISREALAIARGNAEAHKIGHCIEFILADIAPWRTFQSEGRTFDLIVSNPPYIPSGEFPTLQPEVRDFEPRKALNGGPDGLDLIRRILQETPSFLKPGGTLLLEIGENQGEAVRLLAGEINGLQPKEVRKDLSGRDRILVCKN